MSLSDFEWPKTLYPLFNEAKGYLRKVGTVLDIGPGIRPQPLVRAERYVGLESHHEYVSILHSRGLDVKQGAAPQALKEMDPVDTIVMLDVIEHLEREDGEETIRLALEHAREQVVVFTPLGFMKQDGGKDKDPWGLQGQQWQTHRSGWMPEDFPGWLVLVDRNFHGSRKHGAFFAIHG